MKQLTTVPHRHDVRAALSAIGRAPRGVLGAALAIILTGGACYRVAQPPADGGYVPDQPPTLGHQPGEAEDTPAVPAYVLVDEDVMLPTVDREFRGVWVATVGNLDWPSRRTLPTQQQQAELLRILDAAQEQGLNAVIFQIRPMADALYESAHEPWSEYLSGQPGRDPGWDPLAFAIEQAHARGLELHAWFNPFRAGFVAARTTPAPNHMRRRRPDLVRTYGTYYWMDPGEPDARKHSLDVIRDVVRRYDVDAVHIDDYFYPYQERDSRNRLIPFPDDASWRRHGEPTGMTRNDWRRSNIDTFVEQMYAAVKAEKPHVRVGISPFGIWRPGHPASVRGLDSYNELYADSRKWLLNGWADYYAPQLYWRTNAPQQPYVDLLQWWSEQNPHGRHIWAGNIPNNINPATERGWRATEILEQVRLTREHAGVTGNVHFSVTGLLRNPDGLGDAFRSRVYNAPAPVPASHWLGNGAAPAPAVLATPDEGLHATQVSFAAGMTPARWVVHARRNGRWQTLLLPGRSDEVYIDWSDGAPPDIVAISYIDRVGVESAAAVLALR
jgi:uncharacterized lipoprotein YddW (UPF0748 family)